MKHTLVSGTVNVGFKGWPLLAHVGGEGEQSTSHKWLNNEASSLKTSHRELSLQPASYGKGFMPQAPPAPTREKLLEGRVRGQGSPVSETNSEAPNGQTAVYFLKLQTLLSQEVRPGDHNGAF